MKVCTVKHSKYANVRYYKVLCMVYNTQIHVHKYFSASYEHLYRLTVCKVLCRSYSILNALIMLFSQEDFI